MAENKVCPHCGGQMFMAKIIRACVVEVHTDTNETYKILKESKDSFDIEILKCARCKTSITEEDLVASVKCKECGRLVGPMDINENGICHVCDAIKQRTEIANASREDLIKMLLDAEKKANPVAAKMEQQIIKADDTIPAPVAVTTEDTSESEDEEKKPKRRARKKKDDEAIEETVEEIQPVEPVMESTDVTEAVNDIANQQEAPFPDIITEEPAPQVEEDSLPFVTEEPTPVSETPVNVSEIEEPIGADFVMYDAEEDLI